MNVHNVASLLREHALARPDADALRFPAAAYTTEAPAWDTWSYATLDRESDAYARGFLEAGVRTGDRTLFLVKPSLHFYAALFGLFKIGAVPVLLDPGMGMKPMLACIERTKPRVVVAISAVHAIRVTLARRAFASAEVLITAGSRWFWGGTTLAACRSFAPGSQPGEGAERPFELVRCAPDDDAAILFTSGSTGLAKGVTSRQAMFAAQVAALREMFDFRPGQVDLQCFAAFAIFDLCLGMTTVIPKMDLSKPATARPEDIAACVRTQAPDVAFASPIVWLNTCRWCLETGATFPSLRVLLTVGAAIPAWLHRDMRRVLPAGTQVWTPYGATEGMPIAWIGTDEILADTWPRTARGEGTCVGRLAPGADVRVIAITEDPIETWSDRLALPIRTMGEIVVGGDQVSPEYKDAPEANQRAKIRDGRRVLHRMGDLGWLDDRGRLWFCGRKAHRAVTADGAVFGADAVEGIFNEHPDVFRSALIGAGERGRQELVLCVQMRPGKAFDPAVEGALRALAKGTPVEGRVGRILPHPGFPTDARHNSKIRREDLAAWVEAKGA